MAGFLVIALKCAAWQNADPSTLVRAARDFSGKEPKFAATVALFAVTHYPGRLSKPHSRATAVLVDEYNAGSFQKETVAWRIWFGGLTKSSAPPVIDTKC